MLRVRWSGKRPWSGLLVTSNDKPRWSEHPARWIELLFNDTRPSNVALLPNGLLINPVEGAAIDEAKAD